MRVAKMFVFTPDLVLSHSAHDFPVEVDVNRVMSDHSLLATTANPKSAQQNAPG